MRIDRLWLDQFRAYDTAELELAPGVNVIVGTNGAGKTTLLEAIGVLARWESFRGVPNEAMIGVGAPAAVVRGEAVRDDRELLIEIELPRQGRSRAQVNRQRIARRHDLADGLVISVFSPDDLELVKGGPAHRRGLLDETLASLHPRNEAVRAEFDRALRQRNALLKQLGGRLNPDAAVTLDVWDQRLGQAGDRLGALRQELVDDLTPLVRAAYDELSGVSSGVGLVIPAPWRPGGLEVALAAGRTDDLRRGVSLVGPHRDDLEITLAGLPSRTHASQGEQRSLSLALKLAAHRHVTATLGVAPVLLLDDVFSELDPDRSAALLRGLPEGQAVLTSAIGVPPGAEADLVVRVEGAVLTPGRSSDG